MTTRADWDNAAGAACKNCGAETFRLQAGLCQGCSDAAVCPPAQDEDKPCPHCNGTGRVPLTRKDHIRANVKAWADSLHLQPVRFTLQFRFDDVLDISGIAVSGYNAGGWPAIRLYYGRRGDDLPPWPKFWLRRSEAFGKLQLAYHVVTWSDERYGRLRRIEMHERLEALAAVLRAAEPEP